MPGRLVGRRYRGVAGSPLRRLRALTDPAAPGRLLSGTSGFSYAGWAPRFYSPGTKGDALLRHYATALDAVELNNTYYQQPTEAKVRAWLDATPASFRFAVKAQRGGSFRSLMQSPESSVPWLTAPLRWFGERLGTVLFRVPKELRRDDTRLDGLLAAWPREIPLTVEFQDPSWHVDETFDRLAAAGAALCATDLSTAPDPPTLRLTGRFLYVRLRRDAYTSADVEAWADRIVPFLESGVDAFVFFRHDEDGEMPLHAVALRAAVDGRLGRS